MLKYFSSFCKFHFYFFLLTNTTAIIPAATTAAAPMQIHRTADLPLDSAAPGVSAGAGETVGFGALLGISVSAAVGISVDSGAFVGSFVGAFVRVESKSAPGMGVSRDLREFQILSGLQSFYDSQ